jgi:hypothetical protein
MIERRSKAIKKATRKASKETDNYSPEASAATSSQGCDETAWNAHSETTTSQTVPEESVAEEPVMEKLWMNLVWKNLQGRIGCGENPSKEDIPRESRLHLL